MQLFLQSFGDIETNLAVDEALLLEAEAQKRGETLRLWECPTPAVVIGSGGKLAEEINEPACRAANTSFCRRSSGGGTVVLGPGCLCYSLVLSLEARPYLEGITPSYQWILQEVGRALKGICKASTNGSSDLEFEGRKFSGNAQQRKRLYILHHGTLLYDFDIGSIARLLPHPPREPEYRKGRDHDSFVENLPVSRSVLVEKLTEVFKAHEPAPVPDAALIRDLVTTKYATADWVRRR